jgi:nucleotide-binding universal stress UspA family protein
MAKNILLAVDALHYAPEATRMAQELCHGPDDKITVLHVHEFAVGRFGRLQVDCPEGEAERRLTEIRTSLTDAGISNEAEIRETQVGQIAKAVVHAADDHDAHIIVLGSARSTDLPHIPFGSVSLKVLHLAKRPVIVVPQDNTAAAGHDHASVQPSDVPVAG